MDDDKPVKIDVLYGSVCMNPEMGVTIIGPPPPTLWDWIVAVWVELIWPSFVVGFLAAVSITLLR